MQPQAVLELGWGRLQQRERGLAVAVDPIVARHEPERGIARPHIDLQGAERARVRPEDLLQRFDKVRRREQLGTTVAEMLQRNYV